ncbi:MAG: SMC-Scp complex subunit ScpB [Actinomycetaceae bacterium]|nr:SMC-Scp complex subunit ScpB [Actinomycetaceae bacterium]
MDENTVETAGNQSVFAALEALLLASSSPRSAAELDLVLGLGEDEIERHLHQLAKHYEDRGIRVRQAGGGWRFVTSPTYAPLVAKLTTQSKNARLSRAALETLTIIAYRGPVTRAQIARIRGVNVDSVVRSLTKWDLITEAGESASGAILYECTQTFLEKMGINSLTELPPLAPYMPQSSDLEEMLAEMEDHDG